MQRWRYKVLVVRDLALSETKLNAEGEKGWELVSFCMTDDTTGRAFFKQPADQVEMHDEEAHHALVTETHAPV
ncbi:MAG TPA: hypothetical protein VFA07_20230 [Chthonomonadaceae bacterium]|nr:hypothetical protein [Chthonomonadaceae bacterium]